jgi:hypothetical protein
VSEIKNIVHHHHVISISIIIIPISSIRVAASSELLTSQDSKDQPMDCQVSRTYSITFTVRTFVHVRHVPPESSIRARRSPISPMRPQICESRISFPDKEQGYGVPVLKNQGLRVQKLLRIKKYADIDKTYRMCCIPVRE